MGAQTSKRIRYGKTYTSTFFIEIIEIIEIFEWEMSFATPFYLPCKSLPNPLQIPFFSHSKERTWNGPETEVERTYNGLTTEA